MSKVTRLKFFAIFVCLMSIKTSLGEEDLDISQYPYVVALRYRNNILNSYKHVCSGSLYNQSTIITAASCFDDDIKPLNYQIVGGSNIVDGSTGAVGLIDHIVLHYDYSETSAKNDLAVVILKTPLPIDEAKISTIQFAEREIDSGAVVTVIGWKQNALAGSILQSFIISVFSKIRCQEAIGRNTNEIICGNSGDICTQGPGSLLLYDDKLAGILSSNSVCKENIHYYANILELNDWLKRTLRGEIIVKPKPSFL